MPEICRIGKLMKMKNLYQYNSIYTTNNAIYNKSALEINIGYFLILIARNSGAPVCSFGASGACV